MARRTAAPLPQPVAPRLPDAAPLPSASATHYGPAQLQTSSRKGEPTQGAFCAGPVGQPAPRSKPSAWGSQREANPAGATDGAGRLSRSPSPLSEPDEETARRVDEILCGGPRLDDVDAFDSTLDAGSYRRILTEALVLSQM